VLNEHVADDAGIAAHKRTHRIQLRFNQGSATTVPTVQTVCLYAARRDTTVWEMLATLYAKPAGGTVVLTPKIYSRGVWRNCGSASKSIGTGYDAKTLVSVPVEIANALLPGDTLWLEINRLGFIGFGTGLSVFTWLHEQPLSGGIRTRHGVPIL